MKLNPRQWKLYNLIKKHSLKNEWLSRRKIQELLNEEYPKLNDDLFNDYNARLITRDVQRINNNEVIQKVILSTSKGYKLANEDEYINYMEKEKIKLLARLKRHYNKVDKFNSHNQGRLTFTKYERDFIESLIKVEQ